MKTLERQLADFGARLTELHGPIDSSQVRSGLSVVAVGSGPVRRM